MINISKAKLLATQSFQISQKGQNRQLNAQ